MLRRTLLLDTVSGLALPLLYGLLILWRVLLVPGVIFHGDYYTVLDVRSYVGELGYSWIPRTSNSWAFQGLPWLAILSVVTASGLTDDVALKIWLLLSFSISASFVYFSVRLLFSIRNFTNRVIVSSLVTFVYSFNQMTISELIVPHILLAYSSLSLTVLLFGRVIRAKSIGQSLRYASVLLLPLSFLSIYQPALFLAGLVMSTYLLFALLQSKDRRTLASVLLKAGSALVVSFLGVAYWLLPALLALVQRPATLASQLTQSSFSLSELYGLWSANQGWTLINVITLVRGFVFVDAYPPPNPPNMISQFSAFALPALAFAALTVKESRLRNRIYSLAFLTVLVVVFSARDRPFIDIVAFVSSLIWQTNLPVRGPLWSLVKQPNVFTPVLPYLYSTLIGGLALGLLARRNAREQPVAHGRDKRHLQISRRLKIVALAVLLVLISLLGSWPFSGDVYKAYNPTVLPQEYQSLRSFFDAHDGLYRAWWLPLDYGFVRYSWYSYGIPAHPFYTDKPWTLWRSDLSSFLYLELLLGNGSGVAPVLASLGVKYVILHLDITSTSGVPNEYSIILQRLNNSAEFRLAFHQNFLYAFENLVNPSYIQGEPLATVVGGYGTLQHLAGNKDFHFADYSYLFADDVSGSTLARALKESDLVAFSNGTQNEDLALRLLDSFLFLPSFEGRSSGGWNQIAPEDLQQYYVVPNLLQNQAKTSWEGNTLPSGSPIVTRDGNATFSMPLLARTDGTHELWVRALVGPEGGRLETDFRGQKFNITTRDSTNYFRWIRIGQFYLPAGSYNLSVFNLSGLNAIDAVWFGPTDELAQALELVNSTLAEKQVVRLWATPSGQNVLRKSQLMGDPASLAQIESYSMLRPGKYEVSVLAARPFILTLSEKLDSQWKVDLQDATSLPVLSVLNGFYINKTGHLTIVINYAGELTYKAGLSTTLFMWVAMPVLLAITRSSRWLRGSNKPGRSTSP